MGQIDLDKLSAARRESGKEQPTVKFGGIVFTLPHEMPFAVVEAVHVMSLADADNPDDSASSANAMTGIARALFGTRYKEFLELGASTEDVNELLGHIAEAYAVSPGESEASES